MEREILRQQIRELTGNEILPMHMPGHKRRISPAQGLPYAWDITEIEGADNLHNASGILADAMKRTADLFGSTETKYLVGGSTCGILASIRAAAPHGSEIIVARNCHKSVYHAIELGGFCVHWIFPPESDFPNVFGSVNPETVKEMLQKYPASKAVVLTSPTYEGVISDVRRIADICHAEGAALVVDEAHGAHLGLFEEGGFPKGAVAAGADLVIQSAHKMLPSLTQTALLHINSAIVPSAEVERQLNIFETSSPSYPLLASLDGCTSLLIEEGKTLFAQWGTALKLFFDRMKSLKHLHVFGHTDRSDLDETYIYDLDPSKILVYARDPHITGNDLAALLRDGFLIEPEMVCGQVVLLMTSCADTEQELNRLADALLEIDEKIQFNEGTITGVGIERFRKWTVSTGAEQFCTIEQAVTMPREEYLMEDAIGKISAEYIYAYPPGIPLLAPGEKVTGEICSYMMGLRNTGTELFHSVSSKEQRIACLSRD